MFSKARIDTLRDGIFAVAMTLLILDIRLPDDFRPADGSEFLQGLAALWPKFLPYVLSFGLLGLRWLSNIEIRSRAEFVNREYTNWWLLYLLLITCVPFSTIVVGRFAHFPPAIWLYAGHTLLIAAVGLWLATPWGAVVWLTTVVSMAVIELMFPAIYGGSLTVVGLEALMLAVYLALAWMAARERPP